MFGILDGILEKLSCAGPSINLNDNLDDICYCSGRHRKRAQDGLLRSVRLVPQEKPSPDICVADRAMQLVCKVTEKAACQKKSCLTLDCLFLFLKLCGNKTQFGTCLD